MLYPVSILSQSIVLDLGHQRHLSLYDCNKVDWYSIQVSLGYNQRQTSVIQCKALSTVHISVCCNPGGKDCERARISGGECAITINFILLRIIMCPCPYSGPASVRTRMRAPMPEHTSQCARMLKFENREQKVIALSIPCHCI